MQRAGAHGHLAATSAIDYKTDNIIQESLRQNLKNDVTLITIAHRLQTIMDADKIVSEHLSSGTRCSCVRLQLVLDAGRIVSGRYDIHGIDD